MSGACFEGKLKGSSMYDIDHFFEMSLTFFVEVMNVMLGTLLKLVT